MAAYTYKDVCFRDDFLALIPDFEGRYKRECDHDSNYDGDYWTIADMLLENKDETIRPQQAEIERLKGQRDRLVAEVKMYAGSTAYLAVDMRALIAEIEAEK